MCPHDGLQTTLSLEIVQVVQHYMYSRWGIILAVPVVVEAAHAVVNSAFYVLLLFSIMGNVGAHPH